MPSYLSGHIHTHHNIIKHQDDRTITIRIMMKNATSAGTTTMGIITSDSEGELSSTVRKIEQTYININKWNIISI